MLISIRVFLGVAENYLLHQEVAEYLKTHSTITANNHHLGYGIGPRGSPRLVNALVSFLNSELQPSAPVSGREILVLPGVVAVLDALAWSICNEGEGILTPVPFYTGFNPAISTRARAKLLPVSFRDLEGYRDLDDVFDPEMNAKALENALHKATKDGVKVRAVMISNPHNPLGRCYPVETLQAIARFCSSHELHLVSDEVFAMSVYDNSAAPNSTPFTSVMASNLEEYMDCNFVHVAYGMGKDFGATGLRLGVLHSKNKGVLAAVSSISVFGWVPYIVQDMWACILEDENFLSELKAKNRKALAKHFTMLRSFLEQHNIPYYKNVNAGVFIWVDLRQYLPEASVEELPSGSQEGAPPPADAKQTRETRLFKRLMGERVIISNGSSFATEELGWFRISFAVEEKALITGIERLARCLQHIKARGWETK
ncbi:unnamed protein product [Periconia digitata]|uniref:Aminotransferase class I/classII large domain-containing protein n=1 Tax=Periconia digitata TaxID=1303443 RepID=A0A9W4U2A9_9PLEO|nr:unnamed protein product [Periconia digitata]